MQHTIGRYEVIRRLGKGGMGAVYKALVPVIDKVVAIKRLEPAELMADLLGEVQLREIFTAEARTMAGPPMSICSTHSSGEAPEATVALKG